MLQSLILMMLMRNCVALFGWYEGIAALVLMCPPQLSPQPQPNPNPNPDP